MPYSLLADLIRGLDRITQDYRDRMDEIEGKAERELVRIFTLAETGVLDRLRDILIEKKFSMDAGLSLVADIDRMLSRTLVKDGIKWADDNYSLAYRSGQAYARDSYLIGEQLKVGSRGVQLIDDDAVRSALANFTETDSAVFRSGLKRGYSLIREADSQLIAHLRETFVRHVSLGSETNKIVADLVDGGELKPLGRMTLKVRARTIARTELARIEEDAALTKSTEVGIEHFRWGATLDHRTAPDSIRRHGKIKTMDEWRAYAPDKFKGGPPLRPNDRCRLIPIRRKWLDEAGQAEFDRVVVGEGEDNRFLYTDQDREFIKKGMEEISA